MIFKSVYKIIGTIRKSYNSFIIDCYEPGLKILEEGLEEMLGGERK